MTWVEAASLRVCLTAVMIASSLLIAVSVPRSAMLRLRIGESNRGGSPLPMFGTRGPHLGGTHSVQGSESVAAK